MPRRLAWLSLTIALCACEAREQATAPAPPPVPERPAVVLSKAQIDERSAHCKKQSIARFQRDAKTRADAPAAEFAHHYSAKLDTCFYLLTASRGDKLSRQLVDLNESEIYGEFLGPADAETPAQATADLCKVESFYCASAREWDVLVRPYMEN
jgi:hypothetical protein